MKSSFVTVTDMFCGCGGSSTGAVQAGAFQLVSEPVPTVTTLDRCALITAGQEKPRVEDCGFRMLEPHEVQAAMAFPQSYVVTGTRREKVKQLGNAVTPPVMQLLMRRCMASLTESEQAA